MAQVIGYLRDNPTFGETLVRDKLATNLPKEFDVYVECPLRRAGIERFPDFIVLTNFGVIVLEVKDWVQLEGRADAFDVRVRERNGRVRQERNPVTNAREVATVLADNLQRMPDLLGRNERLQVPWGYAVIFPHLPLSVITQLRQVWGEDSVWNQDDLDATAVVKRLKATLPAHKKDVALTRWELACARQVINPSVVFECETPRRRIVLDAEQERIVAEEPRAPARPAAVLPTPTEQPSLFSTPEPAPAAPAPGPAQASDLPPLGERLANSSAIRLIRGIAGSGKTLVLTQRARYLSAGHPDWSICVLSYNDKLVQSLQASLIGCPNVKVSTFDKFVRGLVRERLHTDARCNPDDWLKTAFRKLPIARHLKSDELAEELKWIKETGLRSRQEYLDCERKGRGTGLPAARREEVYACLEGYDSWLEAQNALDWADVPRLALQAFDAGTIAGGLFDAVLIDEAQDFAPTWLQVVTHALKPAGGVLFLADDPSQSIYRYFAWREKGIPVVGRTRWLRVPYRNTRQIYEAAYEVIRTDEVLRKQLEEELGQPPAEPELTADLRTGGRPELRRFKDKTAEYNFLQSEIQRLVRAGVRPAQIAVLHPRKNGAGELRKALDGLDVEIDTLHAPKGLEYEAVFLSDVQDLFARFHDPTPQELSQARRLLYMAMTRARERLYLDYTGLWPKPLIGLTSELDNRSL